jgi:histidine triad (HIT) family protein
METIFSKIINREIPADIVYEDEIVVAFLDINPVNHGHTLVIPKKDFVNIFDIETDTLAHMMKVGHKIGLALKKSGLATGVNLIMNNGESANQEVWHAHLHVVPRLENDGAFCHPTHIKAMADDFTKSKEKIMQSLLS